MESEISQSKRPDKVTTAVIVLYFAMVLGSVLSIIVTGDSSPAAKVISLAVSLGITWWLVSNIAKGRNWARITYLVFFILAMPVNAAILLPVLFGGPPWLGILGLARIALEIMGLVYLFLPPSTAWFRRA